MTDHPILFNTEMVRAILDGRKTQTRRVVMPQPPEIWNQCRPIKNSEDIIISWCFENKDDPVLHGYKKCPYGKVGDRLWVREKFAIHPRFKTTLYRADGNEFKDAAGFGVWKPTWKPSIYMPKLATRIWLEVTGIRVQRVPEISEEDAKAEGCETEDVRCQDLMGSGNWKNFPLYKAGFKSLWDSINKKRGYGWESNPWVWVIEFKQIDMKGGKK